MMPFAIGNGNLPGKGGLTVIWGWTPEAFCLEYPNKKESTIRYF